MSQKQARAEGPSIGWMLTSSSWMLLTAVPGAALAWIGFLIVGVMGHLTRWFVVGVALGVGAIVAQFPVWGQFGPVAVSVVHIAGMLLALVANPQWLQARWVRGQATSAAAKTPQRSARAGGTTSRAQRRARAKQRREAERRRTAERQRAAERERDAERELDAERERAAAEARDAERAKASELAEAAGASTTPFFAAPAPAERAEPIDVNTASANELAGLPGISRSKARSLVRLRDKQGGFRTLEAFTMAADLQPHEIVRLRDAAVCSPPPRGPRTFGRRVDY